MTEVTRHFTATTFVVHEDKVLLHRHPKQGLWLPPGGHIERDELPHDAAVREVLEETGLIVQLHTKNAAVRTAELMECGVVPQPAHILVEDINPFHQHIDFIYYAKLPTGESIESDNGSEQCWRDKGFAMQPAHALTMDGVPTNVRVVAEQAVEYFRNAGSSTW